MLHLNRAYEGGGDNFLAFEHFLNFQYSVNIQGKGFLFRIFLSKTVFKELKYEKYQKKLRLYVSCNLFFIGVFIKLNKYL